MTKPEARAVRKVKNRKTIIGIFVVLFGIVASSVVAILQMSIELPLPAHEQGQKVTEGRLVDCRIRRVRSMGLSVGLWLQGHEGKRFGRMISSADERFYEGLCHRKARVRLSYHAKLYKWRGQFLRLDSIQDTATGASLSYPLEE